MDLKQYKLSQIIVKVLIQCKDAFLPVYKTISRPSYLHNEISYTDETTFLYWIGIQLTIWHDIALTQAEHKSDIQLLIDITNWRAMRFRKNC